LAILDALQAMDCRDMALLSPYPDWRTAQRVTSPFVKADRGGFLAFEARQRPQIPLSPPFGQLRAGPFPKGERNTEITCQPNIVNFNKLLMRGSGLSLCCRKHRYC